MKNIFKYDNPFNHDFYSLTFLEWIIPITVVYTIIILIVAYKIKFYEKKHIDCIFRYILGFGLGILLIVHHILVWNYDRFSLGTLPLDFIAISSIICLLLVFSKNKQIYSLALPIGVIGGMVNMITNQVGYSYHYFRYYQFMVSNGFIMLIPIYFLIVYEYYPTIKEMIKSLIYIQAGIIFIFVFNAIFDTHFMYLTFGENNAPQHTFMSYLGDWPWYIIIIELSGIALTIVIYFLSFLLKKPNNSLHDINVNRYSAYITKKK